MCGVHPTAGGLGWSGRGKDCGSGQQMTFSDDLNLGSKGEARAEPYEGIGDELRLLREQQGHTLGDVAETLRISARYLRAIEEGDLEQLPGPAYVLGFLRSYSNFLGAEPKSVVDRFTTESAGFNAKPELEFPTPPPETTVPRAAVVAGSLVAAIAMFGVWYFWQNEDQVTFDAVPPVPEGFGESSSTYIGEDAPSQSESVFQTPVGIPDAEGNTDPDNLADVAIEAADVEAEGELSAQTLQDENSHDVDSMNGQAEDNRPPTVAALADNTQTSLRVGIISEDEGFAQRSLTGNSEIITGDLAQTPSQPNLIPNPPPPPENTISQEPPRIYGSENVDSRVTLLARQDSWVQVQSAENQLLITRILYSGDRYKVPDLEGLTLITGNAGGLEIVVDGESIPPLGAEGAVRRNIPLEPDALHGLSRNDGE